MRVRIDDNEYEPDNFAIHDSGIIVFLDNDDRMVKLFRIWNSAEILEWGEE